MRRWFGVTALGFAAFMTGPLGWGLIYMIEPRYTWPVIIVNLLLMLAAVGGLLAIVVGLAGAGVAAVRSPAR